jgi:hypothetical protein
MVAQSGMAPPEAERDPSLPLFTGVRGREILGSRDRSKSQQLVLNPRNTCSIGVWLRAKSRLSPVPIRAGAGQSAKVCYRELPRISLLRRS